MVNIKVHERRHKTQILTHWEDQQLHNTAKLLCFSAVSQIMSLKGQSDTTMVISRVILVRYAQPWFMNIIFGVITLCTRKAPWMEFMTQHGEFSRNFFFAYRLPCLSKPLKNLRKCNTWQFWCFFHCTEGRSRWTIQTNHAACSNYSSVRGWLTATANITKWEGQQWIRETETKAVLHPDKDREGEVY